MEAIRGENGLYTFKLKIQSKKKTKTLSGLVDTGSNICACTYKIPTLLHARQTIWAMLWVPAANQKVYSPGYSLKVGFDDKYKMTHVYRLPLAMDGIDFILGLSILSQCEVTLKDDRMLINWL